MTDSAHIAAVTTADFERVVIQGSFERPVLVDFWADWCAPCRQLMPILSRLAEEQKTALDFIPSCHQNFAW